jgi:hypothetical protein
VKQCILTKNIERIFIIIKMGVMLARNNLSSSKGYLNCTLQTVFTSQKTHCIFMTKINPLMLFMETF